MLAASYVIWPPSPPAEPPYIVPTPGQGGTILSCVSSALNPESLQTGFKGLSLVPVISHGYVDGVILFRQGEKIPDPTTVKIGTNVKLEIILRACGQQNA